MEGFRFVANLKPYTYDRGRGNRRFDAYLLSTDYFRTLRDLAKHVVDEGRVLCADNGGFKLLGRLIRQFEAEAMSIGADRGIEERSLRRYARPGDLSAPLRRRCEQLARNVCSAARGVFDDEHVRSVVQVQQAMHATYAIGMEDLTYGVLTALGLEPEYHGLPLSFYEETTDRTIRFCRDTQAGRFGPCDALVFAGIQAYNLDSARAAGRAAGRANAAGIATGLGGALQDRSYVDFRVEDGRVIDLGKTVPRPYVRIAEILVGLHEGHIEATGRRPRLHALGVGTPILLPLMAALGDGTTYTASDSTAPIVDGWSGPTISLYLDDPAPLKYKAYRLAEVWLRDNQAWNCACPYCERFRHAYPPRIDEARRWWRDNGRPAITREMLDQRGALSALLPMLGNPADPGLRFGAAMTRVAHNHWVLQRLERAANKHARNWNKLRAWVDDVVKAYLASPADPAWKAATEVAWGIIRPAAERMRSATPTP